MYRALNTETGQIVAIKQFDIHETPTEEMESLMGEARLLSSLQHPNVVTIFGIIITELHLNIILELIEAGSLQSSLKQFGSMSEKLIAVYLVQILKGLQYLHDKGNLADCLFTEMYVCMYKEWFIVTSSVEIFYQLKWEMLS